MTQHSLSTEQIQSIAAEFAAIAGSIPSNTSSKAWRQVRLSTTRLAAMFVVEASDPDADPATSEALDQLAAQLVALEAELDAAVAAESTGDAAEIAGIDQRLAQLDRRLAALEVQPTPARATKLGASTMRSGPGTLQGWTLLESLCGGRLEARRVFLGGLAGKTFPTWADTTAKYGLDRVVHAYITFRDNPSAITSGSRDASIRQFCIDARAWVNASAGRQVVIDFHHEPEDNVANGEFAMTAWQQAANRVIDIASQERILGGICLMGWTWDPRSGRNIAQWLDPIRRQAIVLIDPYWEPHNQRTPSQLFDPIAADIRARGFAGWAVAETGVNPGSMTATDSANWMRALCDYAQTSDALGLCYFDGTGTLGDHMLVQPMASILGAAART